MGSWIVWRILMENGFVGISQRYIFSLCALLFVCIVCLFPLSVLATTTINDYVVYGLNGVKVGGGSVVNGLVGAQNGYPTSPFDRAIFLNAGATINGDVRSGSNVVLSSSAINGTLHLDIGKTITLSGGSTITATN